MESCGRRAIGEQGPEEIWQREPYRMRSEVYGEQLGGWEITAAAYGLLTLDTNRNRGNSYDFSWIPRTPIDIITADSSASVVPPRFLNAPTLQFGGKARLS